MKKNLLYRTITIIVVLIAFVWGILFGKAFDRSREAWQQGGIVAAMRQNIHLGLDLRGGTHLVLQVVVNDAVNAETDRAIERLKEDLKTANVTYAEISKPDPANRPEQFVVKGVSPDQAGALHAALDDSRWQEYESRTNPDGSVSVTMKAPQATALKEMAVEQAIQKIRERVDKLGVSEPSIRKHSVGNYQILVELPDVDDPARVKEIMQSTAMLELRLVMGGPYPDERAALAANNGVLPPDAVMLHGRPDSGSEGDVVYVVARASAIAGHDLRQATVGNKGDTGAPIVNFYLTADGAKRFKAFTGSHVGDRMAIVLDNKVVSAPVIKSEIEDSGYIEGNFTDQSAKDLALILNSGALPASIRYLEERTVGPSLGMDSIREGITAAVIGMLAVLIFMLIYYKGAGVNADLSLILNLLILLGFLGFSEATLTLPGIAGVILTIGMGVDSNVLIFERIREELRANKAPAAAVDQGFGHAWLTIVDTHVTTIVSALILFFVGTGPVQGFALTLMFGLAANLFTSVFVSRTIFDYLLTRKRPGEALSI
jgi:preprotein translocase subunit SecD